MAWNQPGNNGQDRDPKPSGDSGGNGNKGGRQQGPPDLDDLFRKLSKKLSGFGGGKSGGSGSSGNGSGGNNTQNPSSPYWWRLFGYCRCCSCCYLGRNRFFFTPSKKLSVVFYPLRHLVEPGLNWKPSFVDSVRPVNVEAVRELAASGVMLTSDENVVRVEMNVQYRVTDPVRYLFSVTSPDDSLRQATDSALRGVIGKYTMDKILTEAIPNVKLKKPFGLNNMGITLLDVNFQTARPPEEVKASFDDAIAARENEQQYIREAEAYTNEVQPRANGQAQRILEEARAYQAQTVLEAQGEVARFLRECCQNIKQRQKLPVSVCTLKQWKKCFHTLVKS
ncbi:unnamed protein product [Ranitomeya imitator]|uniref:Band 7 domain-containing protein n=1 Tax=Ranitomeya imitator TaxID=111125 RepID=A0ABN9LM70_9NEOB|nr:unnamed protein product [Ranitomeya imitator]